MSLFQQSDPYKESMKECSEESWLHAQSHVRKVTKTCRAQLDQSDGCWNPKMTKKLSRASLSGSKNHRDAAVKEAQIFHKEVYNVTKARSSSNSLKQKMKAVGIAAFFRSRSGVTKQEKSDRNIEPPIEGRVDGQGGDDASTGSPADSITGIVTGSITGSVAGSVAASTDSCSVGTVEMDAATDRGVASAAAAWSADTIEMVAINGPSSAAGNHSSLTEIGKTQTVEVAHDWVQASPNDIANLGSTNTKMTDANKVLSSIVQAANLNPLEPANATPNLIQEEISIPGKPEAPHYKRMDVVFSFGLISSQVLPSLDWCMRAVQDVLVNALDENLGMKEVITCNWACPPFVQDVQKDGARGAPHSIAVYRFVEIIDLIHVVLPLHLLADSYVDQHGRANVERLLVKAAVPIFLMNDIKPKKARSFVIKALVAALQQGCLKLAEGV